MSKSYIAIEFVDGHKPGDSVPVDKAELWISMYKYPPVKEVVSKVDAAPVKVADPVKHSKSSK